MAENDYLSDDMDHGHSYKAAMDERFDGPEVTVLIKGLCSISRDGMHSEELKPNSIHTLPERLAKGLINAGLATTKGGI